MSTKAIHVFSDYACPWCYLGLARLREATKDEDVDVVLLPFPLAPDTPAEGRDLRAYLEERGLDVDAARAQMRGLLDEAGLPWNTADDVIAYNTSRAQELAVWAAHHAPEQLDALHDVLFRVVQVENRNVWDLDVLRAVAAEAGLDADLAIASLEAEELRDEVLAWWAQAQQAGVRGVPTFISGGRGVSGAQPVDVLSRFVRDA